THITLQFDLSRDIDGAARDVQAAINAARALLPTALPSNPNYRKVNPADAPIIILGLTSKALTRGQMYDWASTVLAQKLLQVQGIGDVTVGGSSLPAVRVELNLPAMNGYGINPEAVRTAIATTNANRPKGALESGDKRWQIQDNDQAMSASEYIPLIVGYHNGAAVRLGDIAQVSDSVQDLRNDGLANGDPAVMLILFRQPGANIIDTVDRVRSLLPHLRAAIPASIALNVYMDRTPTIRASLRDVERALVISVALVVLSVFMPILRMGGVVGRLFREFAITLSAAILVSLVVSLTTTPMMCSRLTQEHGRTGAHGRLHGLSERAFDAAQDGYRRSLEWALAH